MALPKKIESEQTFVLFGAEHRIGNSTWDLYNETPGSKNYISLIRWDIELEDGHFLTDPSYRELLVEVQTYTASRVLFPHAAVPSANTCGIEGRALATLVRWMSSRGLRSLAQITSDSSWDYLDFLVAERIPIESDEIAVEGTDPVDVPKRKAELTFSAAWRDVSILIQLFHQRGAMKKLGCNSVDFVPFDGRSAKAIVEDELGLRRDGRLLPIPDDVAVPTLNAAVRLMGRPAEDVLALQALHENVRGMGPGKERLASYAENVRLIREFEFSCLEGELSPWRLPIRGHKRKYRTGKTFDIGEVQAVRRMIIQLQTACAIVIQGLTGMRAHEMIGVEIETELSAGLPSCVDIEQTRDGSAVKYYLKSKTYKRRKRSERWLLGASLAGSNRLPLPVTAIVLLHRLNAPWRKISGTKSLLITFSFGKGLPHQPSSIGTMTTMSLSVLQKEFVAECVDLKDAGEQSRIDFADGHALRPHRWRTTFAIFVMRVSPKLLPALSDHYKHVNSVVTAEGYIGIDPSLRDDLGSARVQASADLLLRLTAPNASILGGGARRFKEHAQALRDAMSNEPGTTIEERAISLVERFELFLYDAAYGQCLSAFAPHLSRCNTMAGYAGELRPFPNDAFRTPANCSKCELLLITDLHLKYFEDRAASNEEMLEQTSSTDEPGMAKILKQRANQARQIAKLLRNRSEAKQ